MSKAGRLLDSAIGTSILVAIGSAVALLHSALDAMWLFLAVAAWHTAIILWQG